MYENWNPAALNCDLRRTKKCRGINTSKGLKIFLKDSAKSNVSCFYNDLSSALFLQLLQYYVDVFTIINL